MRAINRGAMKPDGAIGRRRTRVLVASALVVLTLAGGALAWRATTPSRGGEAPHGAHGTVVALRETRRTLDPAQFTGKARRAHEVAQEIPDVLDRLRCYCRCESLGHTSLLSCYTDGHAAT